MAHDRTSRSSSRTYTQLLTARWVATAWTSRPRNTLSRGPARLLCIRAAPLGLIQGGLPLLTARWNEEAYAMVDPRRRFGNRMAFAWVTRAAWSSATPESRISTPCPRGPHSQIRPAPRTGGGSSIDSPGADRRPRQNRDAKESLAPARAYTNGRILPARSHATSTLPSG